MAHADRGVPRHTAPSVHRYRVHHGLRQRWRTISRSHRVLLRLSRRHTRTGKSHTPWDSTCHSPVVVMSVMFQSYQIIGPRACVERKFLSLSEWRLYERAKWHTSVQWVQLLSDEKFLLLVTLSVWNVWGGKLLGCFNISRPGPSHAVHKF